MDLIGVFKVLFYAEGGARDCFVVLLGRRCVVKVGLLPHDLGTALLHALPIHQLGPLVRPAHHPKIHLLQRRALVVLLSHIPLLLRWLTPNSIAAFLLRMKQLPIAGVSDDLGLFGIFCDSLDGLLLAQMSLSQCSIKERHGRRGRLLVMILFAGD